MNTEALAVIDQAITDLEATIAHTRSRRAQIARDFADIDANITVLTSRLERLREATVTEPEPEPEVPAEQ